MRKIKWGVLGTAYIFERDTAPGNLAYRIQTFDGRDEVIEMEVPQNYRLEVEQLGRCITDGETPAVSEEFSLANARTIHHILKAIGY